MQVGKQILGVGLGIYDACRKEGAIIATGHEHSYSRTYLMADFGRQTVASTRSSLRLEKGRTFAFVSGLGGESIRSQTRSAPWWASVYTKTQKANYGALFCELGRETPAKAYCYFKDIDGKVVDQFKLVSGL